MLRIVRIQHCKRQKGVRQGGTSPLTVFWFLLYAQKERLGGEPYRLSPSGDSAMPKATTNLASAASGTYQALYKAPRRRQATTYLAKILLFIFPHRKVTPAGQVYRPSPFDDSATPKATTNLAPAASGAYYDFAKDSTPPPGDHQPSHKPHSTPFLPRKDDPHA